MSLKKFFLFRNIGIILNAITVLLISIAILIYQDSLLKMAGLENSISVDMPAPTSIIALLVIIFLIGTLIYVLITNTVKKGNVVLQYLFLIFTIYQVINGFFNIARMFSFEYILYSLGNILDLIANLFIMYVMVLAIKLAKQKKQEIAENNLEIVE